MAHLVYKILVHFFSVFLDCFFLPRYSFDKDDLIKEFFISKWWLKSIRKYNYSVVNNILKN